MYSSGNVTVYVSNMDQAVKFYSETLGLKLAYRFGDHWAAVEAGRASPSDGPVKESKAGNFVGFADPDGNQRYLAEMKWSHVEQGQGEYQHA